MRESLSRFDVFYKLQGKTSPCRPPFALSESAFVDTCTGCGDCIAACREKIIIRGRGGYPRVDFSKGSCTFCAACADTCKAGAFAETRAVEHAWNMCAVVATTCLEHTGISCRACESWCEPRAIRFRPALGGRTDILLDQTLCTGCGACIAPCPQGAISITELDQPANNLEAIA